MNNQPSEQVEQHQRRKTVTLKTFPNCSEHSELDLYQEGGNRFPIFGFINCGISRQGPKKVLI